MPQEAYGRSNIPYGRWSTEEHQHWHVSNIELRDSTEEEEDVIGRQLNKLSNFPDLESLDQACKDLDLGQDFHDYGVAMAGADVVISLSTSEKDTLILPSDLLIKASPWFASALDDRWINNKVTGNRDFNGQKIIMKRLSSNMTTIMAKITPNDDRVSALPASTCYDRDSFVDEFSLFHAVVSSPYDIENGKRPGNSEIEHSATIVANKIALSVICDFSIQLDYSFLIWKDCPGFATMVELKLLQWFSVYLIPLEKASHVIIEFIFHSGRRHEIWRYTWTYLRISYVLRSRELYTAALYGSHWEFELETVSSNTAASASLTYCVLELRKQMWRSLRLLEKDLLTLWPSGPVLARSIWINWLLQDLIDSWGNASYRTLVIFASGEDDDTAVDILRRWKSETYNDNSTTPYEDAAIVASLEKFLDKGLSTTREYFTKLTNRFISDKPDRSFYAMDIESYPPYCYPWSYHGIRQSRTMLDHLVETAQPHCGEDEPLV